MVSWRSASVSEIPGISNRTHSGVDGIHAVHGIHHQLEEKRSLALVPSNLSRSASGRGIHACDHYAGTMGCDRGGAGAVRSGLQNTVRADQEAPVFCAPGGPAWVVVHEMSTVIQGYSQEVRRQTLVQQSFGPSPAGSSSGLRPLAESGCRKSRRSDGP